jgi:hypothetical protein
METCNSFASFRLAPGDRRDLEGGTARGKERDVKKGFLAGALALAFVVLASASNAQTFLDETSFSVDGGLSIPTGDAGEKANLGFCVGFNGFYEFRPNVLIGARVGYNRWGADEEIYENTGFAADADGHWSSFEIVPQVRYLIMPDETKAINFFGQAGLGLYRMAYDVEVDFTDDAIDDFKHDDATFELGFCIGGGISMARGGFNYEIRPMYHIVFTEGDAFTYFAVTGGFVF